MTTLATLINNFAAEGYVFADSGNGAGFGERGSYVRYDAEAAAVYGTVEMTGLDEPHTAEDGTLCHHASAWIDGPNGYRFRLFF